MRYRSLTLCAVTLLCTVATVRVATNADDAPDDAQSPQLDLSTATIGTPSTNTAIADGLANPQQVVILAFPVADLPVWKLGRGEDGKPQFAPQLLTTLIRTIDPESWQQECGSISSDELSRLGYLDSTSLDDVPASIRIHEASATIVVRTSQANQANIYKLIESLRAAKPREEKQKVSEATGRSTGRFDKWPSVPANVFVERGREGMRIRNEPFRRHERTTPKQTIAQQYGFETWDEDSFVRVAFLFPDQELLAEMLTTGRSWPKTVRLDKQDGPESHWPTMPLFIAE